MSLVTWQLFALGGALASVPVLIHLLSRRKVRRVRWAAMEWLLSAMKRHQRRLRLENWLILLLRVAAILLLGLALARPILSHGAGLLNRKRSVYLVLDTSYSTEAKLDARSVFDRIKHEAELVLASVGPDDATALLVTNDPDEDATSGLDPHVMMGRSVGDEGAARAREKVAALRPREARANWVKTLQMLQGQFTTEDVNRQVILVTDLQARDWLQPPRDRLAKGADAKDADAKDDGAPAAAPAAADGNPDRLRRELVAILRRPSAVRVIDVGGRDRRDLAVLSVHNAGGQDPFVGRSLRLAVKVANFGDRPVHGANLEVRVDGGDRRRSVRVPDLPAAAADLRTPKPAVKTVEVDLARTTFTTPGSHTLQFTVTPPREDPGADALALSSVHQLALRVRRRVQVVAWTRTSRNEVGVDASLYLQGVYAGESLPGDTGGPPPIYEYEPAAGEAALLARLQDRARRPVDLVVLANVEPRNARLGAALRDYVREGGGLIVFTGDRCRTDALNGFFHTQDPKTNLAPLAFGPVEVHPRDDPARGPFELDMGFQERPHPLAVPFTNVAADDWLKRWPPKIWGRMAFREPPPAEGTAGTDAPGTPKEPGNVVLRFARQGAETVGPPAIVAGRFGEGRTVWVATSVDDGWLDRSVFFLPVLLEEAAMYVTRPADAGCNLEVGGVLRSTIPADAKKVRVEPPGGGAVSPHRRHEAGETASRVTYEHDIVGRSGIWWLTYEVPSLTGESEKRREAFAVNPDPYEGELLAARHQAVAAGIPEELDLRFLRSYQDRSAELKEGHEGELTPLVLYVLLGVLLLESLLALRFGREGGARSGAES
jgi:hypothetical protein